MRLSVNKLPDKDWETVSDGLAHLLGRRYSNEQVQALLRGVLTPAERIVIAKRVMIGILTVNGWTVEEISKKLKLSKTTVYRFQQYMDLTPEYEELLIDFCKIIKNFDKAKENVNENEKELEMIEKMSKLFRGRSLR